MCVCVFICLFMLVFICVYFVFVSSLACLEMSLFSEYFCTILPFPLCIRGEYVVRFPLPGGVFFTL